MGKRKQEWEFPGIPLARNSHPTWVGYPVKSWEFPGIPKPIPTTPIGMKDNQAPYPWALAMAKNGDGRLLLVACHGRPADTFDDGVKYHDFPKNKHLGTAEEEDPVKAKKRLSQVMVVDVTEGQVRSIQNEQRSDDVIWFQTWTQ